MTVSTAELFGATLDNMTSLTNPAQVRNQLADLLVQTTIACIKSRDGFEQEQPVALALTYLAFDPNAEALSGKEAEDAYHDAYQEVWKQDMDTSEDSDNWNGDFDWTRAGFYPLAQLKRVARACASQDAVDVKAWYKWCEDNPEVIGAGAK